MRQNALREGRWGNTEGESEEGAFRAYREAGRVTRVGPGGSGRAGPCRTVIAQSQWPKISFSSSRRAQTQALSCFHSLGNPRENSDPLSQH